MENQYNIIPNIHKRKKPAVPEGFFYDFPNMILGKIKSLSPSTEVENKPTVPEGFFKNFYTQVADEIAADEVFEKYGIKKSIKPAIPVGYFEKNIFSTIISQPPAKPKGRVYKITFWASVATAAAAGLLILLLPGSNTTSTESVISTETAQTEMSDEHLDTYADYIDEESMVEYIVENDVDLGEDESEYVYDFVESEIEETYLDL